LLKETAPFARGQRVFVGHVVPTAVQGGAQEAVQGMEDDAQEQKQRYLQKKVHGFAWIKVRVF